MSERTKDSLKQDLAAMGVAADATLLVHSSFKAIGKVQGGPDTVLQALAEHLADGLLVFPTLSYNEINTEQPLFKVAETKRCVGLLAELFRARQGVQRSMHPTHSVAALGKDAVHFVSGHECFDTPCAPDSPWGKLVKRDAEVLFMGTGLNCNTLIHGVEEWFPVPAV